MAYTSKQKIIAKGTGKISLADPVASGAKISDAEWDLMAQSLKGSFSIAQDEGEVEETFVDQEDMPIDVTTKVGKITVSWKLPNTAKAMWELLYNTVKDAVMAEVYVAPAGTEVIGVKLNAKDIKKMLKVDMKRGGQTYIFPNLSWSSLFTKDSEEDPACFTISTTLLAAIDETHPDFIVINQMDGAAGA